MYNEDLVNAVGGCDIPRRILTGRRVWPWANSKRRNQLVEYFLVRRSGLSSQPEVNKEYEPAPGQNPKIDQEDPVARRERLEHDRRELDRLRKHIVCIVPRDPGILLVLEVINQEVKREREREDHFGGREGHETEIPAHVDAGARVVQDLVKLLACLKERADGET